MNWLLLQSQKKVNDGDDALEPVKKTLTSAWSFVQVGVEAVTMHCNKLASLHQVKKDLRIYFMTLALHGNTITFDKVIKRIDAGNFKERTEKWWIQEGVVHKTTKEKQYLVHYLMQRLQ